MPSPKLPARLRLTQVLPALGICRATFYAQWAEVFTDYRVGRDRRISEDELTEALAYPDPAKAAVLNLRRTLGRVGR